jgi:hypothetical protein
MFIYIYIFFGFEETSLPEKRTLWSQTLTRGARPDLNSRPAVQISNPLPSRYASWGLLLCLYYV